MHICGTWFIVYATHESNYGFMQIIPVNGLIFSGLTGHLSFFHALGGWRMGGISFLILPQEGVMALTSGPGTPSWACDVLLPFSPVGKASFPRADASSNPHLPHLVPIFLAFLPSQKRLFFFLMWTIFKVFLEFTRILFLFSFLLFWLRVMWDLGFLTRDWTCTPCIRRWSHAWPCNKPFPAPNSNLTHCVFTLFKRYF